MFSLQKFWGGVGSHPRGELSDALLRMAHLLLQAIRLHAVEGDKEDYVSFQAEIRDLDARLGPEPVPSTIPVIAGSTMQALQNYNRRTSGFIRAQGTELQEMVAKLTDTVAAISGASERSIGQLENIQNRIQQFSVIQDIRVLNLLLSECLQDLKQETLRQREEAARTITLLRSALNERRELDGQAFPGDAGPAFDPVSGLPSRTMAETALQKAFGEGSRTFIVLFVIQRLEAINNRLGRAAGDQALKLFSQDLAKRITTDHKLFRWSGPCFVVLLERSEPIEIIQREISRITSRRLDLTIEVQDRPSLIPLSTKATIIPAFEVRSIEMLIQQLDSLVISEIH